MLGFEQIFPPFFIMLFGALLMMFTPAHFRKFLIVTLPTLTLIAIWQLPQDASFLINFLGQKINLINSHDYSLIFSTAFGLAALAAGIFALERHGKMEIIAAYIYASGAIGITYCGDFLSLFILWEMMAIASTIVVICGNTSKARSAAFRYAIMHFFGGVVFLSGIIAYYLNFETFNISSLFVSIESLNNLSSIGLKEISSWLILIALLVNLAAPPFSSWLADSYPESTPWGGVFLSTFTTKTSVFVLLTVFAGNNLLIPIGLFMVCYGIIWAMLENNLRRILSYSIINQVGFMVTAIGIGTPLALAGAGAHAFCHIMYKGLLFMSAGSVIEMTGKHKCSEVGGLFRTMKFTTFAGIIGALAISAFPLTSGFVSKSLITSASANEHMLIVWLILIAASAGVFLHAGVKFPWFAFFQKDSGLRPEDPPINMKFAMGILIALCIVPGFAPEYLYRMLPIEINYSAYSASHVVAQLQLLLFAGFAFFVFLPMMKRTETISLDWDFITRKLGLGFLRNIEKLITGVFCFSINRTMKIVKKVERKIYKNFNPLGKFTATWKISDTVFYTTILLSGLIVIYFII